jgi:hypothetical protein
MGLGDLWRRGHAPQFSSVTRCEIIALACDPIGQKNTGKDSRGKDKYIPITRTIEQVRQEAISRDIVPKIGWTTVQRILSQGEVRPHLVRDGCTALTRSSGRRLPRSATSTSTRRPAASCSASTR